MNALVKRCLDVALSLIGLALMLPLGLLIAGWIRVDSPGPAVFRQVRVGLRGVPFTMHKFRTMHAGSERDGPLLAVGADARVTGAGRWLRRTRLDEWPQLFDVLRGKMSLVGPRPEVPRYASQVSEPLRSQWLSFKPGLSDPASLAWADEAQVLAQQADAERYYVQTLLPAKVQASTDYAQRATWWSDLKVLSQSACWFAKRVRPSP